jgi:hypothetical protein
MQGDLYPREVVVSVLMDSSINNYVLPPSPDFMVQTKRIRLLIVTNPLKCQLDHTCRKKKNSIRRGGNNKTKGEKFCYCYVAKI